jgi:hypothetical protein
MILNTPFIVNRGRFLKFRTPPYKNDSSENGEKQEVTTARFEA